ncbi:MAG TPA: serine/threonine protein kinase [Candidatus Aminicenantes bacterium]|nr:serine/threonine protein kinase [Candidatus Aminicenantes bacterium]
MDKLPEIPGYHLQYRLGEGGMAKVYFGMQTRLKRRVAVKVMESFLLKDENFSRRFLKEAETAANLNHPNIVTIYDVGQAGENYYMVMEFLDGTLKERIRQTRKEKGKGLDPEEAMRVLESMAQALEYAHSQGYIHRDIKPDNIMFRNSETPVLVDFGIAKAIGTTTKLTKTGMSIGTPHYMSPEQIRGLEVDGRADLYSLGVLFYEMLTGDVPYKATDYIAVVMKHLNDPVPSLPPDLARFQPLLERMMAKDNEQRFQDGRRLLQALRELKSGPAGEQSAAVEPTLIAPVPEKPGDADDLSGRKRPLTKRSGFRKAAATVAVLLALATTALLVVLQPWKAETPTQSPIAGPTELRGDLPEGNSGDTDGRSTPAEEAVAVPAGDQAPEQTAPGSTHETGIVDKNSSDSSQSAKKPAEEVVTRKSPEADAVPVTKPPVREAEKASRQSETGQDSTPEEKPRPVPLQKQADARPPAVVAKPETVKIIQVATNLVKEFSGQLDRIVVNQLPRKIKVVGNMTLELNVEADGAVRVVKAVDANIVVTPSERTLMVRRLILEKLNSMHLPPPRDRDGRSVRVEDWRLSYAVGTYEGRIILKRRF